MKRLVVAPVIAIVLAVAPVARADEAGDEAGDKANKKDDKPSLAGTLYGELGIAFNVLHIPETTADAGFGFRFAFGFQFHEKLRVYLAYRSLSNENKDMPGSEEDYSDISLGLGFSLDGKYFAFEGELTRPSISGSGFSEGGFGAGIYFTAGYPLHPQFKVIGRVGAYAGVVDIPSRGGNRVPLWGIMGIALVYQGAPWASL